MQHPVSPHRPRNYADALALLVRQRDLGPHLHHRDRLALASTSRQMMQASYPRRPPTSSGRGCVPLAAQLAPDDASRRIIMARLANALQLPSAAVDERTLGDCRDLLWRGDAWRTGAARHVTPAMTSEQRRRAIALMAVACRGLSMDAALAWVDTHRRADWAAVLALLAADAAAVGVAGCALYGAYSALRAAHCTAQAARNWWALGGVLGAAGGVGFGVATGGLGALAGGSATLGVQYVTCYLAVRAEKRVGVPHSVQRDLALCELVVHRRHLHPT